MYGGGGKRKVGIVGHAKSSVGVCRRPFWESGQRVGMCSIKYAYIIKLLWLNWLSVHVC
jgi:hypothetical protein